jgi:Replicative DNA helicase
MNADLSLSDATLERLPPQSLEAEQAVLGALLVSGDGVTRIVDSLDPEYFYRKAHQVIFAAMLDLYESNEPIDIVTISQYLKDQGKLENVGGRQYITDLSLSVATTANLEYYAKVVQEKAIMRALIKAGTEIVGSCYEETDADVALDRAEHSIFTLAQKRDLQQLTHIKNIVETSFQKIEERYENRDALSGVPSGFYDLDAYTSGFQPSDLVIIAARPSMGKCLAFDSELVLADGSIVTIEELYKKGTASLLTLVNDSRLVFTAPSAYVDDGVKPVFKVTTRTGRSIETTLTHPFLTIEGWKKLSELKAGMKIGVPNHMPVFGTDEMRDCEVKLLAYLIGDGSLSEGKANFSHDNVCLRDDFSTAAKEFTASSANLELIEKRSASAFNKREFGHRLAAVVARKYQSQHQVALSTAVSPSSLSQWISGGCVPDQEDFETLCTMLDVAPAELAPSGLESIHRSSQDSLVLWLSELGLWGTRPNAKFVPPQVFKLNRDSLSLFLNRLFSTHGSTVVGESGQCHIAYTTESKPLAQQVQHLLLRFGVVATLKVRSVQSKGTLRPSHQIEITDCSSIQTFIEEIGIFSREEEVEALRRVLPPSSRLNDSTDVMWDEIVTIDYMGRKQVYDLTIPQTHNFIANDICVHNTAFVLNLAQNAAVEHNIPVAIFSLEMSKNRL